MLGSVILLDRDCHSLTDGDGLEQHLEREKKAFSRCASQSNFVQAHFIADFNGRFGKEPRSAYNAHRPLRDDEDLDLILTCRASRCVSAKLTVQYDHVMYLLDDTPLNRGLIHHHLDVYEYPDGRIEIRANSAALTYRQYDRLSDMDQRAVVDNKRPGHVLEIAQRCSWSVKTGGYQAHHRGPIRANR